MQGQLPGERSLNSKSQLAAHKNRICAIIYPFLSFGSHRVRSHLHFTYRVALRWWQRILYKNSARTLSTQTQCVQCYIWSISCTHCESVIHMLSMLTHFDYSSCLFALRTLRTFSLDLCRHRFILTGVWMNGRKKRWRAKAIGETKKYEPNGVLKKTKFVTSECNFFFSSYLFLLSLRCVHNRKCVHHMEISCTHTHHLEIEVIR